MRTEHEILSLKISQILHEVFVDIRALTWPQETCVPILAWIEDLADLAHNLPRFQMGMDDFAGDHIRDALIAHAVKRWPEIAPERTRYLRIFDLDEAEFERLYLQKTWAWPEPETIAVSSHT